jgi:hypothetical protein
MARPSRASAVPGGIWPIMIACHLAGINGRVEPDRIRAIAISFL